MRMAKLDLAGDDEEEVLIICPTATCVYVWRKKVFAIDTARDARELSMTLNKARSELDHALREIR